MRSRWRRKGCRWSSNHARRGACWTTFSKRSTGCRIRRPDGGPARAAAAECGQGGDAKGAGGLRTTHGAEPAGQHFRSGPRDVDLVGRIAAQRALRRLNAVKVETQRVPVVFEPRTARSLLDNIFEAVHGMSIYRQESFLAGKLGEKVASDNVTVIDDGTLPGLFGTSPFDDEGVASRRTVVIERGVLKSYLMNTYAARKLGMKTTGNASRGLTGNAGIGHGNFFLEKGVQTPEQIIAGIPNGFYVTELMGFGVNVVTGDYSRGAAGLWIRNGELAFAVSEVTIAGNLNDMLQGIAGVGSDLEFRGSVAAPTIKMGEMTVGGK